MTQCKFYERGHQCGKDTLAGEELCIEHSTNPEVMRRRIVALENQMNDIRRIIIGR